MIIETKGSYSFQEQDQKIFKGRNSDTEKLLNIVLYNDFSTLYASSGEGKSSLINAGLIPSLRKKGYFPVVIKFSEEDNQFIRTCLSNNPNNNANSKVFDDILVTKITEEVNSKKYVCQAKSNSESLSSWLVNGHFFSSITDHWSDNNLTPVIIFDQFEEVFTQEWTRHFWEWLCNLYTQLIALDNARNKFKVLLSLRSDYICELDYWSIQREEFYIPQLKHNRYYLKPLTISGAKEVVEQYTLPTGITVAEIIEYAKSPSSLRDYKGDGNEPYVYALTLMMVLTVLKNNPHEIKHIIKQTTNNSILDSLIESHYETVLSAAGLSLHSNAREVFERALTNDNGKRIRVNLNNKELQKIKFEQKYLNKLVDKRIITKTATDSGKTSWIEFSHDSLLRIALKHHNERQEKKINNSHNAIALIIGVISILYGLNFETGITEEWVDFSTLLWKYKLIDIWHFSTFSIIDSFYLLYAIILFPQALILQTTHYKNKKKVLFLSLASGILLFAIRLVVEKFCGEVPTPDYKLVSHWNDIWPFYSWITFSQIIISLFSFYNVSTSAQTNTKSILRNLISTPFASWMICISYTLVLYLASIHYFIDSIPLIFFSPLVLLDIILLYRCLAESHKFNIYAYILCIIAFTYFCRFHFIYKEYYLLSTICALALLSMLSVKKFFVGNNAKWKSIAFPITSILITIYSLGYNPLRINGVVIGELSQPWEYVVVKQKGYDKNTVDVLFSNGEEILTNLKFEGCSTNYSVFNFYKQWNSSNGNQYYDIILGQPNYPLHYDKDGNEFTIYVVPSLEFIVRKKLNNTDNSNIDSLQAAIFLEARREIVNSIYQNKRMGENKQLKNMFEALLSRQYSIYRRNIEEFKKSETIEEKEKKSLYLASRVKDIRKSLACYLSTLQLYEVFCAQNTYTDDDIKQQMVALQVFTSLQILTKDARHFNQIINANVNIEDKNKREMLVSRFLSKDWLNDEVGSAINWIYTYDIIYHPLDKKLSRWFELIKNTGEISHTLSEEIIKETTMVGVQMITAKLQELKSQKRTTKTVDFSKLDSLRNEYNRIVNIELFSKSYASPIFSANTIKDILSLIDTQTPDYNAVFMDLSKILIIMGSLRDIDMHTPLNDLYNAVEGNYGQMYRMAEQHDSLRSMYNKYIDESNKSFCEQDSLINELKKMSIK